MIVRPAKPASSPFERRLKAKHNFPDHCARTLDALRRGHR